MFCYCFNSLAVPPFWDDSEHFILASLVLVTTAKCTSIIYTAVLVVLLLELQLLLLLHQLLLLIQLHCNLIRVKYEFNAVFGVVLLALVMPLDCLTGSRGSCTALHCGIWCFQVFIFSSQNNLLRKTRVCRILLSFTPNIHTNQGERHIGNLKRPPSHSLVLIKVESRQKSEPCRETKKRGRCENVNLKKCVKETRTGREKPNLSRKWEYKCRSASDVKQWHGRAWRRCAGKTVCRQDW